ncbi:MAG: hypothetical protein FWG40_01245 [Peptococcaceae bacterium]|nr:hypothetical protein [Peptococcaceae bacterium]
MKHTVTITGNEGISLTITGAGQISMADAPGGIVPQKILSVDDSTLEVIFPADYGLTVQPEPRKYLAVLQKPEVHHEA